MVSAGESAQTTGSAGSHPPESPCNTSCLCDRLPVAFPPLCCRSRLLGFYSYSQDFRLGWDTKSAKDKKRTEQSRFLPETLHYKSNNHNELYLFQWGGGVPIDRQSGYTG